MKKAVVVLLCCLVFVACKKSGLSIYDKGVSKQLAEMRAESLSDITYDLFFNIPLAKDKAPEGNVKIGFSIKEEIEILLIDFRGEGSLIKEVLVDGKRIPLIYKNEHIHIEGDYLGKERHIIEISFVSSLMSLNRDEAFLYTLLVPDRASTLFPCFDQPDLKAVFSLELEIPSHWKAMSNSPVVFNEEILENRRQLCFAPGKPISTYLFAFTAGEFEEIKYSGEKRNFVMFHRETDHEKVNANKDEIFRLHEQALQWLENYTGIVYPFDKFDFALIPGFQYSGMEHPGCIFYRDSRLILDDNPPATSLLRRANLISHETAHIWFGDLVTMKWFDDVWLKEVFAGFMADKIIQPLFPEYNYALAFLIGHFPKAMSVDRSGGTHPIKQQLNNLNEAGSLYGAIIYDKAPIVFQQLEILMGEAAFRSAVKDYLVKFSFRNADWLDLVEVLDAYSDENISGWSDQWIFEKGLPEITYNISNDISGNYIIDIEYSNEQEEKFKAAQVLDVLFCFSDTSIVVPVRLDNEGARVSCNHNSDLLYVQINANGRGYAFFNLDCISKAYFLANTALIEDDVMRAVVFINIWEDFLNEGIEGQQMFAFLETAIEKEEEPQILAYLLSIAEEVYWRFLNESFRSKMGKDFEEILWRKINISAASIKYIILPVWIRIVQSPEGVARLYALWSGEDVQDGLNISEENKSLMAKELILKKHPDTESIIKEQTVFIEQAERRADFLFIIQALSDSMPIRNAFINSLKIPSNRRPEPRVIEALRYFYHPVNHAISIQHLYPSLEMVPEIQKTGDIFFPKDWCDAILWSFNTEEAVLIVERFLNEHQSLSYSLKNKILQSSDMLLRASRMKNMHLQGKAN